MPSKISIITPIRGNADMMEGLIENARDTADDPSRVELVFYIDSDDASLDDLLGVVNRYATSFPTMMISPIVGPRVSVIGAYNAAAARSVGDVMVISNDGLRFKEDGWDTTIDIHRGKYPDDIALFAFMYDRPKFRAKFDDGEGRAPLAVFPAITRKMFDILGYLMPPGAHPLVCDPWLNEVAFRARRFDVILENHTTHIQRYEYDVIARYKRMPIAIDRYKRSWRYRVDDARRLLDAIEQAGTTEQSVIERLRSRPGFARPEVFIIPPHETMPPASVKNFADAVHQGLASGSPLTIEHGAA